MCGEGGREGEGGGQRGQRGAEGGQRGPPPRDSTGAMYLGYFPYIIHVHY